MQIKYGNLVDGIRTELIRGSWQANRKLPTRDELVRRYNTSRATIQKAMDQLLEEGFIESRGKSGTFTAQTPPHLTVVGLVFQASGTDDPAWDALWSVFVSQKTALEQRLGRTLKFYYLEQGNTESDDYHKLLNDAANSRLAGIVFPFPPPRKLAEELNSFGTPVTAVTREQDIPDVSTVWVDYASFLAKSLDYLSGCGRRRIALLANTRLPMDYVDVFCEEAAARKLKTSDYWIHGVSLEPQSPPWAARLVRLMFRDNAQERPDGLIVANQNLLDYALAGLQTEGLRPGRDLDIAVQTSFPALSPNTLPVKRIGFDVRRTLDLCVECINAFRDRRLVNHDGLVDAQYEEEINP